MIKIFQYDKDNNISFFYIKVSTGAKSNNIKDIVNIENKNILRINIKERPIEGKANEAIMVFLSSVFKVPKINFQIKSGKKSKIKKIIVENFDLTYLNSQIVI